jgi:hemerythrin superfamily protein
MASQNETLLEETTGQDAIELLMADHHRVAKLFAEFATLKDHGSDEEKSALVAQICQELTVHTAIEEELFYPAVRKAIDDDDLMDEALVEHAGAKQLIAQLRTAHPDDDLYDAKVAVLGEQIDHHVEEEEGSLFAQAKGAGVDTLSLGVALLKRKAELVANADEPPVTRRLKDDDASDPRNDQGSSNPPISSVRPKRHRRPATTQGATKKASHKAH